MLVLLNGCSTAGPPAAHGTAASLQDGLVAGDAAPAAAALQTALEHNPRGVSAAWRGEATGHSGSITPVRTFRSTDGRFCREYRETLEAGGRTQTATASACRDAQGTWRIV